MHLRLASVPLMEGLAPRILLSQAAIDSSFGVGGTAYLDSAGSFIAMATQKDGKILAAGWTGQSGLQLSPLLARFNPQGTLDPTFGSNGVAVLSAYGNASTLSAVAVLSDGKILAAGTASQYTPNDHTPPGTPHAYGNALLLRLNPDGSLDSSFGNAGQVLTKFHPDTIQWGHSSNGFSTLLIQSDGTILAAGYSQSVYQNPDFALARYKSDGSLDTSFGTDGKVITDFTTDTQTPLYAQDTIQTITLQSDGKILALGNSAKPDPTVNPLQYGVYGDPVAYSDFALARYNPDGTLDAAFGSAGKLVTNLGGQDYARQLALLPDGDILVAGRTTTIGSTANTNDLLRYNTDGSIDTAFGPNGTGIAHPFATAPDQTSSFVLEDMFLQTNGRILLADHASLRVGRLNADLTPDSTFGTGGLSPSATVPQSAGAAAPESMLITATQALLAGTAARTIDVDVTASIPILTAIQIDKPPVDLRVTMRSTPKFTRKGWMQVRLVITNRGKRRATGPALIQLFRSGNQRLELTRDPRFYRGWLKISVAAGTSVTYTLQVRTPQISRSSSAWLCASMAFKGSIRDTGLTPKLCFSPAKLTFPRNTCS